LSLNLPEGQQEKDSSSRKHERKVII
jgi:hypothetical protein